MNSLNPRELRPYALFWKDGKREVVWGETIADAFSRAGYSQGAISALDFSCDIEKDQSNDACNYHWNSLFRTWERIPEHRFVASESAESVVRWMNQNRFVDLRYTFPSGDVVRLSEQYGRFYGTGWLRYIEVSVASYVKGPYSDDGDETHHFMGNGTLYYSPEHKRFATGDFLAIIRSGHAQFPNRDFSYARSVEEIKANQPVLI